MVLFLGPEEGEKHQAIQELRGLMESIHHEGLEYSSFYAFESSPADVLRVVENGSLFGTGMFVRYRGVEALKRKEEVAALQRYAASPVPSALIVLESSEVSVAADLKKAVGAAHTRVFWEMFENQKQGWLMSYFRRHDVRIDADAVELLLELVDNNTLELRHEADRLMGCVGNVITAEDVDRYVYHAREESIFTLHDAMMKRDLEHALDILAKLVVLSDPVQILLGLSWQVDRLYLLQLLRSSGTAEGALFTEMGRITGQQIRSKRQQRSLMDAAQHYTLRDCAAIRLLTGDTDALLRTVPAPLHSGILQQYLYSVIIRGGGWRPSQGRTAAQYTGYPGESVVNRGYAP